jgi:hypothetical protein
MSALRFRGRIEINTINPYVLVSASPVAKIQEGWRRPLPVLFRVNGGAGDAWRVNLMPVGDGSFYLYLHGGIRKASGTKVGDVVDVEIEFDGEYKNGPMHPMPVWFGGALNKNPKAKQAWSELIPSRQKEMLRYFANLKSPEAQERNLGRAMAVLSGSKERFMGRLWNG